MRSQLTNLSDSLFKLTISAEPDELALIKEAALKRLSSSVKVPGFRAGKAPQNLIEKNIDQTKLQTDFLDQAISELYAQAVSEARLRPVANPKVNLTKFVPYSTLEFSAEVEAIAQVKLPPYKDMGLTLPTVSVSAAAVDNVLASLAQRSASRKPVTRSAKKGDEVVIDFNGLDQKTKQPIEGASGQSYPLLIGSGSFIPGFEAGLVGLKANQDKQIKLSFPADYGVESLRGKPAIFKVKVRQVNELSLPDLTDDWAKTAGPFESLAALKEDIKRQLKLEKEQAELQKVDNQILESLITKTQLSLPAALVEQEVQRLEDEEKRALLLQGQTWAEHLKAEGITEAEHKARKRPLAERQIKAGLILGEIAESEGLSVDEAELRARRSLLKERYKDPAMQQELDDPSNEGQIKNQLLIEKTLARLRSYNLKIKK